MQIVYAKESLPKDGFEKAIFLAGPTPRTVDDKTTVESWRPEAIKFFEELGYDGTLFIPEERGGKFSDNYIDQVEWEEKFLNMADCILFWVPRELKNMPAFTTNIEWGVWEKSGKVVFGAPEDAEKVKYLQYYANKLQIPSADTLKQTVKNAINMVSAGAKRVGGECCVPLCIWNTPSFQQWYGAQKKAGNRLDNAKVEWVFKGPKDSVFFWILHVDIYITKERRNKTNEVVIARPDISFVVLYKMGRNLADTDIVLIREFRSPANTSDGNVLETPSGSSLDKTKTIKQLAIDECLEETGLKISPRRIKYHQSRQLMATLSAHRAHLFSAKITDKELQFLQKQKNTTHGVVKDTEKTYVEIVKFGEILKKENVDWSMIGMISSVLLS